MEYREHKGLRTSEVGIGCYALGGAYGSVDVDSFKDMLCRAYELGVNFFDTADAYGDAERLLGEALRPFRDEVLIATKVGIREGARADLSAAYVEAACETSLRNLGTDYIDLYQVHFDDPGTPVEETVGALEDLVRAGKVRHYGVGHLPVERLATYFRVGHVSTALMELSAVARSALTGSLALCRQHDVGAIAFSVTGRGLLTGKIGPDTRFEEGDIRRLDPLFQRERFTSGLRVAARMTELGARHGRSPVQMAIAWVLAQPGVICALTGPSSVAHLEENVAASGWALPAGELEVLEALFQEEDAWLAGEQWATVVHILSEPLPPEPEEAFTNLVYACETSVQLGLISESGILPLFQELFALREETNPEAGAKLEEVQQALWNLLEP